MIQVRQDDIRIVVNLLLKRYEFIPGRNGYWRKAKRQLSVFQDICENVRHQSLGEKFSEMNMDIVKK